MLATFEHKTQEMNLNKIISSATKSDQPDVLLCSLGLQVQTQRNTQRKSMENLPSSDLYLSWNTSQGGTTDQWSLSPPCHPATNLIQLKPECKARFHLFDLPHKLTTLQFAGLKNMREKHIIVKVCWTVC